MLVWGRWPQSVIGWESLASLEQNPQQKHFYRTVHLRWDPLKFVSSSFTSTPFAVWSPTINYYPYFYISKIIFEFCITKVKWSILFNFPNDKKINTSTFIETACRCWLKLESVRLLRFHFLLAFQTSACKFLYNYLITLY